jgi:pimeloyl-ACP methyl ester carboxylesterase
MSLDDVVLVGHDWGGALAMDWAARHPGRVRGIAVAETFLRPVRSEELAPAVAGLFRAYRSPEGEKMVMEDNMVIEVNLARGVASGLAAADLDVYRAPFLEPASRKPMLAWTREFPLDGEPADVVEVVLGCGRWMAATPGVPKLIMAWTTAWDWGRLRWSAGPRRTSPASKSSRSGRAATRYLRISPRRWERPSRTGCVPRVVTQAAARR